MAETRCKYYKQKKQVSYDGGQTWQDVIPYQYQRGELYEYESADCGALVVYRWVNMDPSVYYYCEGTTKYYKQKRQVSYDGGQTWQYVTPPEYQRGGVAEQRSTDCGYVPPTPQYKWIKSDDTICVEYVPPTPTDKKFVGTYSDGKTLEVECNGDGLLNGYATKPSGYDYSKMTNAVIGQCVTRIARYAGATPEPFSYCTSLTSVTIPDSVTDIGASVFYGCSSLPNITIPTGVTNIYKETFTNCTSLANVTLPSGLTFIGGWAFLGCTSLTSVTIPDNVTSISTGAFSTCTGLTSVKIPDSLTSISQATFQACHSLTSIVLPNNLTSIGSQAFQDCIGLTSINIPDNVITIGNNAFLGCTSLTSVTIGSGVTTIGSQAFDNCPSLTSVTINATTPPFLPQPSGAFDGSNCAILVPCESLYTYKTSWSQYADRIQSISPCGNKLVATYSDGTTREVECNGNTELGRDETMPSTAITNAVIGNCVTKIGLMAFDSCSSLTSINIPNSVTIIDNLVFADCRNLTSINIPDNVTTIGRAAFYNCSSLTSINIPNSVTNIGGNTFGGCSSLTSVTVEATTPPTISVSDGDIFFYTPIASGTGTIYVPSQSVSAYKSASGWSTYSSRIQAIP